MSEYQYYAFRAIDRALTPTQLRELRALSTRARISPTSFVNEYHWGDFKGRPRELMERYFDFHFYFANWGTRIVMLRVPKRLLDPKVAATYCRGHAAETWTKGDYVLFDVTSEEEPEYDEEVDEDYFQPMVALRDELMRGDHRLLYLFWLLAVQAEEVDDDEPEPPVPPGLGDLTMAQTVFCEVMRVDRDLVWAAAERSAAIAPEATPRDVGTWLKSLPLPEKDAWLGRLVAGETVALQAEILARYHKAHATASAPAPIARTVSELRAAAEARAKRRRRDEARKRAAAKAEQERKLADDRAKRLDALAPREAAAWKQVDAMIASRKPSEYDAAVALLVDLQDLAAREGREEEAWKKIEALRTEHARKPTLLERMDKAKLAPRRG